MFQEQFAQNAAQILKDEQNVLGLAAAGSWITGEIDKFSDLDLVLVTLDKIGADKNAMQELAGKLGVLLNSFTGEHVGEPRLLICMYDSPLIHVDIKFLTLEEFHHRVETPVILVDKDEQLKKALENSEEKYPYPDQQWIEDRFWTWIHYALLKTGRGEYLEAFDFLGFLRMVVLGPLLHITNNDLPRGVRKVESALPGHELNDLLSTVPQYNKISILESLANAVMLYKKLRLKLFATDVQLNKTLEEKVMQYFEEIKKS